MEWLWKILAIALGVLAALVLDSYVGVSTWFAKTTAATPSAVA